MAGTVDHGDGRLAGLSKCQAERQAERQANRQGVFQEVKKHVGCTLNMSDPQLPLEVLYVPHGDRQRHHPHGNRCDHFRVCRVHGDGGELDVEKDRRAGSSVGQARAVNSRSAPKGGMTRTKGRQTGEKRGSRTSKI